MFDLEQIGGWVIEEEARRAQLLRPSASYAEDPATRAMLKRRRDFELMLGEHPEDLTSEQRQRARELAEAEPWPDTMTRADWDECRGIARHL